MGHCGPLTEGVLIAICTDGDVWGWVEVRLGWWVCEDMVLNGSTWGVHVHCCGRQRVLVGPRGHLCGGCV